MLKQYPELFQGLKYSSAMIKYLVVAVVAAVLVVLLQHQLAVQRVEVLVVHQDKEDSQRQDKVYNASN